MSNPAEHSEMSQWATGETYGRARLCPAHRPRCSGGAHSRCSGVGGCSACWRCGRRARPSAGRFYLLRPEIRAGIAGKGVLALPVPSAQQIAWTSADDAALATLALFDNEAFGRDCLVSGPESVDGEGLARALSEALRRDIEFQSLPLEALERQIDSAMGAGVGNRVTSKFRFFEAHPDEADKMLSPPFEPCRALSGFIPTAIRAWASERRSSFS
jgi:hypothetical protein